MSNFNYNDPDTQDDALCRQNKSYLEFDEITLMSK